RPEGPVEAWVDDGWTNVVWRRTVDMTEEPTFKMELTRATPGSLRIHLKAKGMAERLDRVIFGVDDIKPLTPCPDDFEAYWKGERARLEREVPIALEKTPAPHLNTADYDAFYVSVATFDGGRIYAMLTVPKGDGVFPVCVTVPGAGPGSVAPSNPMARKGWISITMNIHGFPIAKTADEQKARYNAWLAALKKKSGEKTYQRFGFAAGRNLPIYHNSILGMVRMLDWLANEPYADASRFVYFGGSQGGGYGLYLTSMWERFAKSVIYFPNMCDMMAYREGRQPGSEHIMDQTDEHRPAAELTGPYYDACNFARLIRTPIRIMHGLSDDNCHTVGGIAAYNSIPSKDKKLLLIPGLGHRWIKTEFEQWLFE
ncbi:MAG: acetylxylan esterase, partial [Victivallales bacterium]|nr:acetylxylan esterase [Victivallales bacterium]